jgi:hypothetical protein
MKKFIVIAAVNALLLGGLSIVGINALVHGCNVGGSCIGSPGMVTWGMAIVPLLIMAGAALKFAPGAIKSLRAAKADDVAEQQAALEATGLIDDEFEQEEAVEVEGGAQFESRLARFRAAAEREEAEAQMTQEERDVRAIADNEEADSFYSAPASVEMDDGEESAEDAVEYDFAKANSDDEILSATDPVSPDEGMDDDLLSAYEDNAGVDDQPVELTIAPEAAPEAALPTAEDEWAAFESALPSPSVDEFDDAGSMELPQMPSANSDAALRIWGRPEDDGAETESGSARTKKPDFLASLAAESWDMDDAEDEGEDGGFAWNFKPMTPSAVEEVADAATDSVIETDTDATADDHAVSAISAMDEHLADDAPIMVDEPEEVGLDFDAFNSRSADAVAMQDDDVDDDYAMPAPLAIIGQHPDANANGTTSDDDCAPKIQDNWHGLFDDMVYGGAPVLRSATVHGFPWVAAGIGFVAQSLQDHIRLPAVGAYPAEITAWGQIAESLPFAEPIGAEDCEAFVDWTNGLLAYAAASGQSDAAATAINAAVSALLDEAANDAEIADELPGQLVEQHIMMLEQRHARRA